MAQQNQTYKRSLAGSVGAGLGSVFNAGGRTYFILEHKVSSKYHKAGESQEIIVDQIEIGRDPKCQVQFDETFHTVSRRHAAIVREGDNWKLIQLSQTNQTFLNGRPVTKEWYLQNGDEIQLSVNGPKLGFIVPTGNKSKTGSIALSRRLSLFREQALKPYKTAMAAMAAIILLLIVAGATWGVIDYQHDQERELAMQDMMGQWENSQLEMEEERRQSAAKQAEIERKMRKMQEEYAALVEQTKRGAVTGTTSISACEPSVYFVYMRKVVVTYDGESKTFENLGSGTGFMLSDGRFITARHVVEPWMYLTNSSSDELILCNAVAHNGGEVECFLDAYSPPGEKISLRSSTASVYRATDETKVVDGVTFVTASMDASDYASFQTIKKEGLPHDNALSRKLPVQAKLTILGYPMGLGANSPEDIHPIYSEAVVAREGLHDGLILTTATTFEPGNSGGPVFASTTNGELIVVGVVHAIQGRSTGYVVPISAVK